MFHNGFPSRQFAGQAIPEDVNFLDFAIHERPKYIPNSNPICKATPMLENDGDGIILDFVLNDGGQRYIVGFKDSPDLRVSVGMMDITNWVSARTFEQWHWERTKEEEQRIMTAGLHWRQKKMMLAKTLVGGESREDVSTDELPGGLQPGLGLSGKLSSRTGPASKRGPNPAEQTSTSRRLSIILSPSSKRGRGLASQTGQLGLAQIPGSESGDSEDEEEDTNIKVALAMQLNNYGDAAQVSESDKSRSTSISIELPVHPKAQPHTPSCRKSSFLSHSIINSKRTPSQPQSPLRQATPSSSTTIKTTTTIKPSDRTPRHTPASSSSRIHKSHQIPASEPHKSSAKLFPPKPTNTPFSKPSSLSTKGKTSQTKLKSFFLPNQTLHAPNSQKPACKRTPTPEEEEEEEEEEAAWNVEKILDDDTRLIDDNGRIRKQTYYLLKWEGDYDDTWEPSENVASKLKRDYKREKATKRGPNAAKAAVEQKKRKRGSEDRSERGASKRMTTMSRSRSPLFMNEDEDMVDDQDEMTLLPSSERRRQTRSPIVMHSTNPNSKTKGHSRENNGEVDTAMSNARQETPEEDRGLFLSRTPPRQIKPPINLRSSSEEEVELVGGKVGVIDISSEEESD